MKSIRLIGSVFLLAILLFTACARKSEDAAEDQPLNVVATIGMIADVAENIGGEKVSVTALMGPGVDPHLYKASAGDVDRLTSADLILFNGLHLEAAMGEVLERMESRTPTVAVSESVDESNLISAEDYESSYDPHVWFDVSLWRRSVTAVRDALIEADEENADYYREQWKAYDAELEELEEYVVEQLNAVGADQRVLITAHDAFGYFGAAYGFEVRGLQGISTVSEAGTRDVQELAQFITDRRIPAIFIESSVPRKSVEALQAAVKSRGFAVEIGGELFSDAMGDPGTEEGTYLGMVRHNVDTIVKALGQ